VTDSSLLDSFCQYVQTKYEDPWSLTIDALGREYGMILLLEAATGQRSLFANFVEVHFPFREVRGLHCLNELDGWIILYSMDDEILEQLRTKLHEIGEIVERRLSELWPDYGIVASVRRVVEGDARYDRFADEALTSAFSFLINVARFLWETAVKAWRWIKEVLRPYVEGLRQFLRDFGKDVIVPIVLLLLCLALYLINLTISFLKWLLGRFWDLVKAMLRLVLVFLARLFLLDQEIRI